MQATPEGLLECPYDMAARSTRAKQGEGQNAFYTLVLAVYPLPQGSQLVQPTLKGGVSKNF